MDEVRNIIAARDALHRADMQGLLNDIADDLRLYHKQLSVMKQREMSVELGEICLLTLEKVFKQLEKHGVSCDER